MLQLKLYQQQTLETLEQFLIACRTAPVAEVFQSNLIAQWRNNERYQPLFGNVPCVCLRIPTGGGKTLLAAHIIALAHKALSDNTAPVALWLTPSETIRTQTLEALNNIRHPYRQALTQHFGDQLRICDLDSLQTIRAQDTGRSCIIIVATIQAFNVSNTTQRNVYAFNEELALHFKHLPAHLTTDLEQVTEADLHAQPYLTQADIGRVKHSVANWLHLQHPLIIVDEAHNNRTDRFFKSLGRLNPSCVIELTATPVAGNNVLYSVSAQELKTEQMIKLPIVLTEHPDGWQACLRDAILTRNQLELTAQKETDYIRPILLVQAAPKGNEATVEVVRQHLITQENSPKHYIAVATGTVKELDPHDLFSRACQIRIILTVEALKEGWDCSFAYVLASLQTVKSAKDVEQLLGRVLRMPYAKTRQQPTLNQAYAHIIAESFAQAAMTLTDRLVQNMGFERLETATLIIPQQALPLTDDVNSAKQLPVIPDCQINVRRVPETQCWPDDLKAVMQICPTSQGATILLKGNLDANTLAQVETRIVDALPIKERAEIKQQFDAHRAIQRTLRAPARLGVTFAPIPQLCLWLENHFEVVEPETLAALGEWDLLDQPVQLAGFTPTETINSFEIDVHNQQVEYRYTATQQLQLNEAFTYITKEGLIAALDQELRQPFLSQLQLQSYLLKLLAHLIHDRGFTLTTLVRSRFQLTRAIAEEIKRLRQLAMKKGFQQCLFDMKAPDFTEMVNYNFQFQPGCYPARNCYQGQYRFQKHFYPLIHELREKTETGKPAEEFICARAIDKHNKVKHWVRNIERQMQHSFWLPTSTDRFYPDFVAELNDGRVFTVEYKGQHYKTNDDSREKEQIGRQWEKTSDGRCLFLFAVAKDEMGRSVSQQVADKLA